MQRFYILFPSSHNPQTVEENASRKRKIKDSVNKISSFICFFFFFINYNYYYISNTIIFPKHPSNTRQINPARIYLPKIFTIEFDAPLCHFSLGRPFHLQPKQLSNLSSFLYMSSSAFLILFPAKMTAIETTR